MKFCGFLLKAKLHFDQSILIVSWEGYVTILLVIMSDAEPEWVPQLLRMCSEGVNIFHNDILIATSPCCRVDSGNVGRLWECEQSCKFEAV